MTLQDRHVFTRKYLATAGAVAVARKAAERTLLGWGLKQIQTEDAGLVVSELVTNAIKECPHAEIEVTVAQYVVNSVTVEVWDPSPVRPRRQHPEVTDLGGRGLGIVEALSSECGSRPEGTGKTVYAVIPPPS